MAAPCSIPVRVHLLPPHKGADPPRQPPLSGHPLEPHPGDEDDEGPPRPAEAPPLPPPPLRQKGGSERASVGGRRGSGGPEESQRPPATLRRSPLKGCSCSRASDWVLPPVERMADRHPSLLLNTTFRAEIHPQEPF